MLPLRADTNMLTRRIAIRVRGQVQGVGFRPHVFRLAQQLRISGWVGNDAEGVRIEAQGIQPERLLEALRKNLPPLAKINAIEAQEIAMQESERDFTIRRSVTGRLATMLPADTAVCSECLAELFDPDSRYYHYPFLNCTHCGPRYSVVQALPYDRANTALRDFVMCPACESEYHAPRDRRFHAQPTACPSCGPQLSHSAAEIMTRLRAGEIVAVKGLGGYQLICDAGNAAAVAKLRQRKQRDAKPFAVMALNVASLEGLVSMTSAEVPLLTSAERPIVLLAKDKTSASTVLLTPEIAPGLDRLGVMLPGTPLHYLLMHAAAGQPAGTDWLQQALPVYLVITSANPGGEPLVIGNDEANKRLADIADTIVTYNRDIVTPVDDSVVQQLQSGPQIIRRARGYVPQAIALGRKVPSILAVGGHLKNTVCITRGDEAFVSQHIGSLDNPATVEFFETTIDRLRDFLQVDPAIVAHDLHPEFVSTRYAHDLGLPCVGVQHHHAHLAAVAAEHHIEEAVLGLCLDGYGMSEDGTAWGGELFLLQDATATRLAHLRPMLQPGGERAAREPWRMAVAILADLGEQAQIPMRFSAQAHAKQIGTLLEREMHCLPTTSCGRLFDAVSALLGVASHNHYEGEAAMRLQSLVSQPSVMRGGWLFTQDELDLRPLLHSLLSCDAVTGANRFHGTLAAALSEWVSHYAGQLGIRKVLLAGGCLQNPYLCNDLTNGLQSRTIEALLSQSVPVNDGGLSLGQAWVAALRQR
jgi:hydrogenase maturation protein HypF